jgi:hypothetical protein
LATDTTTTLLKEQAARKMALPVDQIKFHSELTETQKARVVYYWGKNSLDLYVYAVKQDGDLVWNREKIARLSYG